MSHTTGFSHHAAGGVYQDVPVDLPIEPLVRETPDEFRARMDAKRDAAAATRLPVAAADPRPPAPLPVGPAPTPRPRPTPAPLARGTRTDKVVIVTAYVNGDTIPQIAAATGHARSTVRRLLLASGVQLRHDNTAKGLSAEIAAAGLTSATLRAWAAEHDIHVTHKGIPGRAVLDAYLADPARNVADEASECEFVSAPPAPADDDPLHVVAADDPRVRHSDTITVAAALVAESILDSHRATTPEYPEPEPEPDAPPIVTALAAISGLAVELAGLRPHLSSRERRVVDATLVALGSPDPSLIASLWGAR